MRGFNEAVSATLDPSLSRFNASSKCDNNSRLKPPSQRPRRFHRPEAMSSSPVAVVSVMRISNGISGSNLSIHASS
ncbi:hypothetical protein M406DRAFT_358635 [Cryphonectria parasitica EP155]|uniref:Uncharacterized protein n=1 Tax=Cryphonectria parasitica (strain ATCC 38755 / EP155) TaxID=660469 RepID=A0A9P5CK66_CRYP1|nr:uncharacterized protein M406DRAFT_358635 [Cryphonectria parasitica EP155]KAF3760430.1 hypothetical protein M406DRAFT_358635 [Cryphonectria parasitica EP155]